MVSDSLAKEFQQLLGKDQVFLQEADRLTYAYDAAVLEPVLPALVVRPKTTELLGRVARLCNENGLPLTVRGAGTNLSGGTIPHPGGVVVLTNALNQILEINEEDLYAVVQPGVVTAKLAQAVEARGLFYPPDPGSMAVSTLGGNVAENAGGLRGLKYGVTLDYIMGLEFFSAAGETVKTGSRTVKCVTGYNLTGLLVGSEGTLGVISQIILKLIPLPQARQAMLATFGDVARGLGDRGRHHRQPHRARHPGIPGQLHHPHRGGLQPRRPPRRRGGAPPHRGGRPPRGGGGGSPKGGGHLPRAWRHVSSCR